MEEFLTLGQAIYQEIDGDERLRSIYQKLLKAYGAKLFGLEYSLLSEEELNLSLVFADLLSKSIDEEKKEKHKLWAQEIILLLSELYPDNSDVNFMTGSVLTSISNYKGLRIQKNNYHSGDILEELCNELKKRYLRIPTEQGMYFFEPQKEIFNNFESSYFSYSAPTSLGKSFVMQMFIKEKITSGENCNFAIIVPSKALINEVSSNLTDALKDLLSENDYKIVTSAGASALEEVDKHFIFVMTPERFMYLMILFSEIYIDYLFIDEAHKITKKDSRSAFYYQIVGIQSQLPHKPHIIFASPNIPNPEVFLHLVHGAENLPKHRIATCFSPVCQEKFLVDFKKKECFSYDDHNEVLHKLGDIEDEELVDLIARVGQGKKNIVYFGSKDKVIQYAKAYAKKISDSQNSHDPELEQLASEIREIVHEDYYLADLVSVGVAYHNGVLPASIRLRIEKSFKSSNNPNSGIRTLFCTSTLLEGVNLPADNLFIADYHNGGRSSMPVIEFKNLMGRVGRIQYNLYGNVIFACVPRTSTKEGFVQLLRTPVFPQQLSVSSALSVNQKKTIADCIKDREYELPRSIADSDEEYAMLRKFFNILLRDIVKGRNSFLLQEFSEYFSEDEIAQIRADFSSNVEDMDEDIDMSFDQNESLMNCIRRGVRYPKIGPGGVVSYDDVLRFLNELCIAFRWDKYEPQTLGFYNSQERAYTKLKKYAFMIVQWVSGKSVHDIIIESINHYHDSTVEKINERIVETLEVVENTIQFSLSNYFLKFSKAYRKVHPDEEFDDWYDLLEYGTTDGRSKWLQRNGFSRESALYIARNNKDNRYLEGDEEGLYLKMKLLKCRNQSVRNEAWQVYYNNKDLFKDEIEGIEE